VARFTDIWLFREYFPHFKIYTLDSQLLQRYSYLIERFLFLREKGYPFQYIIGNVEFFGFKFFVKEGVFIPRQETEIMVEEACQFLKDKKYLVGLDLCCGIGNIGISLCKVLDVKKMFFIDISTEALFLCKKNADFHQLKQRCIFIKGDLFSSLKCREYFDFIVVNPPYIDKEKIKYLAKELSFEPPWALYAKDKGMFYIKKIFKQAPSFLKKGGYIFCEIGYDQKDEVEDILKMGAWKKFFFKKDLNNIFRVAIAQKK